MVPVLPALLLPAPLRVHPSKEVRDRPALLLPVEPSLAVKGLQALLPELLPPEVFRGLSLLPNRKLP